MFKPEIRFGNFKVNQKYGFKFENCQNTAGHKKENAVNQRFFPVSIMLSSAGTFKRG